MPHFRSIILDCGWREACHELMEGFETHPPERFLVPSFGVPRRMENYFLGESHSHSLSHLSSSAAMSWPVGSEHHFGIFRDRQDDQDKNSTRAKTPRSTKRRPLGIHRLSSFFASSFSRISSRISCGAY